MATAQPNSGEASQVVDTEASQPINELQHNLAEVLTLHAAKQTELITQSLNEGFRNLMAVFTAQIASSSPSNVIPTSAPTPGSLLPTVVPSGGSRISSPAENQMARPPTRVSPTSINTNRSLPRLSPFGAELRPDRISQIIANWKLKFSGRSGIFVEDFIYRVEALTTQTLDNNYELLARYVSNLFEGSATEWFWRYHKSVSEIRWEELKHALRVQFREERTDVNIRAAIDRRKQKENESFDEFYEAIVQIADKLSEPLPEAYLLASIKSNLLPEIQHELLYEKIETLTKLRSIVRKREVFFQTIQKPVGLKPRPAPRAAPRFVHEVDIDSENESIASDSEVAAINQTCWNCCKSGHRYQDCLAARRVFCFGCGQADTYRPTCPKCSNSKNSLSRAPQKSARKQVSSKATNTD